MTFDPTPGRTMAQQNSRELRGGGATTWKGPQFENPKFAPPAPWRIENDCGLTCGNCCGPSKRTGPQERQCIRCAATWTTSATTAEEQAIERFREKERAK